MTDSHERDHLLLVMHKVHEFLAQTSLCDLVVYVENSLFRLHRCIVAAACPLLHHLIVHSARNLKRTTLTLVLQGIKADGFRAVVRYFYSGKAPKDRGSETWSDFVHACQYLSLPYPVYEHGNASLCKPTDEIQVLLKQNDKDVLFAILCKKSEQSMLQDRVEVPVEFCEGNNDVIADKSTYSCGDENEIDSLQSKELVFELDEGVSITVQKSPKQEAMKTMAAWSKKSVRQPSFAIMHRCSAEEHQENAINCCGRVLIETRRETAANCVKVNYICYYCQKTYVAAGALKVHSSTQTAWAKNSSLARTIDVDSNFLEGNQLGAEVEIHTGNSCSEKDAESVQLSESGFTLESDRQARVKEDEGFSFPLVESDDDGPTTLVKKSFYSVDGIYRPHRCNRCGSYFSRKHSLKTHQELHCGEIRLGVRCSLCNKELSCLTTLRNHAKAAHPGENVAYQKLKIFRKEIGKKKSDAKDAKFFCQICSTPYNIERHFLLHSEKCRKLRKLKCPHCPMRFRNHHQWEKHLWQKHDVSDMSASHPISA